MIKFARKHIIAIGNERIVLALCMLFSLILWFAVQMAKTYQTTQGVRMEYKLPSGKIFKRLPPAEIDATVESTGWKLLNTSLFGAQPVLSVDLRKRDDLIMERQEIIQELNNFFPVPVVNVNTSYIFFELDSAVTRKVPIVPDNRLSLAQDHFLSAPIRIIPDSVTITGTAGELASVTEIVTEPLVAVNVNCSVSKTLMLLPPSDKQVRLDAEEASVFIQVERFTELIFTLPIELPEEINSYVLYPKTVELTCIANLNTAPNLSETDFRVGLSKEDIETNAENPFVPVRVLKTPASIKVVKLSVNAAELYLFR